VTVYKWRKSSCSSAQGNCVEVASNVPGRVAVRDSKDPGGARLAFERGAWEAFTAKIKAAGQVHGPGGGEEDGR
jgi:uncharacterized protein DUF397